ncbi:MAG: hypothetical protein A2825_01965 [Candidatus Taylorbacteria bacterium RIFCSPHIGHO2_01_FULL_43_120]|nr:MAG: hypothetical protein A2825_01965 [Candidatus Taylorbacteria bacterium RIFCSPHIGHO2_01_FULL_43_120]OHA22999.1 MAG: hypothetical protein A3B98_01840 [Candidatus Taylorbacteria bacterium RIFCSPHIGHO2_02_FULL_43_55]OHA30115.1 MAG: hypothetical protein A3E92_00875 [Candidatus Taylorbacteria bacterium RIFCSPHIGHO2_12_FULL_42_34]OHA30713.1 MAG: hypothetical protein A3B09_01630 [Candidatus Taylorbacteria bacterium RIFCSPLOWO2_01_FULL_43_83]OHA39586.1 MAG: hypothetical protein A3H58_02315 [Candi
MESPEKKIILHVDGDAFFASCEVALNPKLKGKPVVTGLERGIASALTYEAKALGIKRGMPLWQIRKICPGVIVLPSNYEMYSMFSERMSTILKRYAPVVEDYSIDECFADLSESVGVKLPRPTWEFDSYVHDLAVKIKKDLQNNLGMTFSLGISCSKVLAKVASKWNKPDGLTVIGFAEKEKYLSKLPVNQIWGIGGATSLFLAKKGIKTALDFTSKDDSWAEDNLNKPYQEIRLELKGFSVYPVREGLKDDYKSISKTRTFTPPSSSRIVILSELSKNAENACIKMRRHGLSSDRVIFFIKTQNFQYFESEVRLDRFIQHPNAIMKAVENNFNLVYDPRLQYRATGVTLANLAPTSVSQRDFFGQCDNDSGLARLYGTVDQIAKKYGKHSVFLCSSFHALKKGAHSGPRGSKPSRNLNLFMGETSRKRLRVPFMGETT